MKRTVFACLATVLIAAALAGPEVFAQSTGKASADSPQRITVVSYNIHHGEGIDGRLDLERIAEVIRETDADLVSLQEVDQNVSRSESVDQPQEFAKLLKMHVAFGGNIDLQGGKYGNAVLSRFPIVANKNHLLPNTGGGEQRGVLEVDVELPHGGQLIFLATHLDHRSDPAQRLDSAKFINEAFAIETKFPVCLTGDLNAVPDSSVLDAFRKHWTLPDGQAGLTIPVGTPNRKIDYILVGSAAPSSGIRLREVETRVLDEAVASDHRAILSVFEVSRGAAD